MNLRTGRPAPHPSGTHHLRCGSVTSRALDTSATTSSDFLRILCHFLAWGGGAHLIPTLRIILNLSEVGGLPKVLQVREGPEPQNQPNDGGELTASLSQSQPQPDRRKMQHRSFRLRRVL